MPKKITDDEKKALIHLAMHGGIETWGPREVCDLRVSLYKRKYLRIWKFSGRESYFLTDLGWRAVLRFCRPAKSDVYKILRKIYKDYKEPELKMEEEVYFE